jgi:hypothetical protein
MNRIAAILAFAYLAASGVAVNAQSSPRLAPPPPPAPFHIAINAASLAGFPRVTIQAIDEKGHIDTYTGISLHDLIVKAGAPTGELVRGKAMLSTIVVSAADNYHVLFLLPEIDPSYTDHVAVIAETIDGKPFADAGPYRLIVPFEKRQARWVRQLTSIDLLNITPPAP